MPQPSAPAAAETTAVRELFRQHCVKCHGSSGTGNAARSLLPEIPDFADASWQVRRSDAQLMASILDGKGAGMPPGSSKISKEQARGLAAYVRSFAPKTGKSGKKTPEGPDPAGLDESYRRLQEQMDKLGRQFREQSKRSPGGAPSKPSESLQQPQDTRPPGPPASGTPVTAESQHHQVTRPWDGPTASEPPAARKLFQEHCVKCHGADGTGSPARRRLPKIPNFTDASWQARKSDAQLMRSILKGKGQEMPPAREKISDEQARALAAYVRAFAPTTEESAQKDSQEPAPQEDSQEPALQEEPQEPAPAERAKAEPPLAFSEKLIRWLGRFHSPAVHFPIGLLTAAAVAELLRLATGKPAFDAVSRYCVCLGALTAAVAGILGWFMGSFRQTDPSWVLTMHRWLGTSTVVCAGLALVLSEASCRPDRHRTRIWFRVALVLVAVFVSATGFLGGAVVFGLDHFAWPQ